MAHNNFQDFLGPSQHRTLGNEPVSNLDVTPFETTCHQGGVWQFSQSIAREVPGVQVRFEKISMAVGGRLTRSGLAQTAAQVSE